MKTRGIFLALVVAVVLPCLGAIAADLPLATSSPLVGFTFDDRPLILPMQRNFQMAMLTAGSELGRSCGRMESYGWRMSQSEQWRVNQIFNNTVDRLRAMGFTVEAQTPPSVSRDITLFTADRLNKHYLFMWSAGEIGLVMVVCETSAPLGSATAAAEAYPKDVVQSKLETPAPDKPHTAAAAKFTPLGNWEGNYTCMQGYTGATLKIASLKGENFTGVFHFYPTAKNPYARAGSYTVYGQYDKNSQRILINPGKWLEHPKDYYNTIIVGSFDPVARSFSAYFQGVTGCTSFEAKYAGGAPPEKAKPKKHKAKKKKTTTTGSAQPSQPSLAIVPPAEAATTTPGPVISNPVNPDKATTPGPVISNPANPDKAATPGPQIQSTTPATVPAPAIVPNPTSTTPSPQPVTSTQAPDAVPEPPSSITLPSMPPPSAPSAAPSGQSN